MEMRRKKWIQDAVIIPILVGPFILLTMEWFNIPALISAPWNTNPDIGQEISKRILWIICFLPLAFYFFLTIPELLPFFNHRQRSAIVKKRYFNVKFAIILFVMLFTWLIIWHYQYVQFMLG